MWDVIRALFEFLSFTQ